MCLLTFLRSSAAAILLTLFANVVYVYADSESVQTGWLELVKGSRDDTVGAQLIDIEAGDTDDTQKITVAIPKTSLVNRDDIEEVVIVGQQPPEPEKSKPIKFTYEWVTDLDSDNYGLVIRLGKDTNWPIRLYMNSDAGFTQ